MAAANHSINLLVDASELLADDMHRPETFPRNDSSVKNCSDPNVAIADCTRAIRSDKQNNAQRPPTSTKVDEMELLRKELEEMKSALAQKEEAINVLQSKLSAKEAECDELHNVLQDKSSAIAAAESRETVLKDAMRAAEEKTAAATATAAERFAIMKNALIIAEDEAAVAAERAKDTVTVAESRCHRLEKEVKDLTTSVRTARAEAKRAKKEQAERETLWMERSEILLAECDRRGRALMIKIGEQELPGVRDEKGRQAYRYQRRGEWDREHLVRQ
jgi:chromosome segregation ATPase